MPISLSSFTPERGTKEYFFTVTPDDRSSFLEELSYVFSLYKTKLAELKLGLESGGYMNIYISDALSQEDIIRESSYFKELDENNIAVSILQLPPLFSKVALLAYHIVPESIPRKEHISFKNDKETVISLFNNSYTHYFLKGLSNTDSLSIKDQTKKVFDMTSSFCKSRRIPYKNIVRTWIYLKDINRDYASMVETRREIFLNWGLTEKDKFPASTGIGGRNKDPRNLLLMDAIIIDGIKDEQFQKMEALTHMSPPINYGVPFERGLKVRYGDRNHLYISGTASIDSNGNVIHQNDLLRQTERTLENIRLLLKGSSSSIDEVAYFVVYLGDPADAKLAKSYLKENLPPHIPCILLQGDLCRPAWLIEIEGMAISKSYHSQYNNF